MSGTFTASLPTYTWAPATGLNTTTGSSVTASPTSTGTYTVTGTDAIGCTGTATKTVTVGPAISVISVTATPSTVCSGGSSALNAVATTSATGYSVSSITYGLQNMSGATLLVSGATNNNSGIFAGTLDDGSWNPISLGFNFTFDGTSYSSISINTNGYVQFGQNQSSYVSPVALPNASVPNAYAGSPWIDLIYTTSGTVGYKLTGSAGSQKFIIQWAGPVYQGTDNDTAQIILNEGSNNVEVMFAPFTNNVPKTYTLGVENSGGTSGTAAPARNASTASTSAGEGWRFSPAAVNYSWAPSTFLNNASISNPNASNVTATTTYTVTASDAAVSACTATGSVTLTYNSNVTYYQDNDNDTYGNPSVSQTTCTGAPAGYVANNTDCNDNNSAVHPGATEVCNTIDDNCNGQIDEGVQSTFYADADNDSYGNAAATNFGMHCACRICFKQH